MDGLRATGEQLIEAVAYGDAAGLPVETMCREEVQAKYGWLGNLVAPTDNPFYPGNHEPGVWSDDTELTMAVAQGLLDADGFELEAQAETHLQAYWKTPKVEKKGHLIPRGWGRSTTRSMRRLANGISPQDSGEPEGAGNGILMKMAPLVYWQAARGTEKEQRYAEYDALTRMTHASDVAIVTSRLHGDVLHYLLRAGLDDSALVADFPQFVQERAIVQERSVGTIGNEVSKALGYLSLPDSGEGHYPEEILDHTDGKGFYAPQTLAMAYGAFYWLEDDYYHTVYQAVNLGGDTDSIASIVGAMMDFIAAGDLAMPEDVDLLQDRHRLNGLSRRLAQAALRNYGKDVSNEM